MSAAERPGKRAFTIADDIGLTHFFDLGGGKGTVSFSPDGNYFVVWSERGRLELNRVEDALRIYRSQDVKSFLERSGTVQPPTPLWVVSRLGETGSVIDKWRWLADSSGLAFLQHTDDGHRQLVLADVRTKSTKSLTPAGENVAAFEVQDGRNYSYSSELRNPPPKAVDEPAATVGTGRPLVNLLFANQPASGPPQIHVRKVIGGKRFEVNQNSAAIPAAENLAPQLKGESSGLEITVEQGLNDPPLLIAKNERTSRVLWDPNPQLGGLDLGQASIFKWKDKNALERRGGLYKPSDYEPGQRYPLVIQTHDFDESRFSASGSILNSSYAARALAAAGNVVLQLAEDCPPATTGDGPCAVSAYESAINQLVSDGIADPDKVGIVAFSWPSFYVMKLLTSSGPHIKAALIANAQFMGDYFQHIALVDDPADPQGQVRNSVIGGPAFGEGLEQWLKNSPSFHLDRITTPLMMVAQGRWDSLLMWAPYAGLHYLQKPVDLIELKSSEHNLTNPRMRMLSQGETVDWFRFWLQGYEDPDPAKAEQYKRWRELRKAYLENERKPAGNSAVPSGS
jgi:dipeptidyl aminopeptidase/acylaminoacyl peptidase